MSGYTYKKIYIFCPSNVKSGGPELLHQLSYAINKVVARAYMVYYPTAISEGKPDTNPEFEKYCPLVKKVDDIHDRSDSLIIVPEAKILLLQSFRKARKAIWWLSVDNFTIWGSLKGRMKEFGLLRAMNIPLLVKTNNVIKHVDYHYYQSYYAKNYIIKCKKVDTRKVFALTDYVNDIYLKTAFNKQEKKNKVAYFPTKGYEILKKIIAISSTIEWCPIQNMSSEEVRKLLLESKVYVDFGGFPGKDRIPREAALCGCCIITGCRGASNFFEDVPIKDNYKFDNPVSQKEQVVNLIEECFNNYDERIEDFIDYRNLILKEKEEFLKQVDTIFNV